MSSYNVLDLSDRGMRFLGRNTLLTRELGSSEEYSRIFEEAEAKDKENHSIGAFRGVRDDFFFEVIEPHERVTITPWNIKPSELIHHKNPDEEAVHNKSLENFNDFIYARKNSEIRNTLVENDDLRDNYLNGDPTRGFKQDVELAEYANLKISNQIGEENWLEQPDVARLAVENRGELGTLINENEELRDIFLNPSDQQLLQESRERVVDAVVDEISLNDDLVSREFLEDNPRAALYLLQSPEDLNLIQIDRDFAKQFTSQTEVFVNQLESEMAEEADGLVNAHPFSEDWFESNHEFAEIVVSDKYTLPESDLGTFLISKDHTYADEVLPETLADEFWAKQAKSELGEDSIPDFLLNENSSLSRMIVLNEDVAQGIKNDASAITASYNPDNKLSYTNRALSGYGLGLGDRQYGDYLRLA